MEKIKKTVLEEKKRYKVVKEENEALNRRIEEVNEALKAREGLTVQYARDIGQLEQEIAAYQSLAEKNKELE